MPIIRNIGSGFMGVVTVNGAYQTLAPTQECEVYFYPGHPDLLVVSDNPVWSRIVSRAEIDLSDIPVDYASDVDGFTGAMVPVGHEVEKIYMLRISGSVTAYRQSPESEPELKEWTAEDPIIPITAKQTLTRLYLEGVGSVEILQVRREL